MRAAWKEYQRSCIPVSFESQVKNCICAVLAEGRDTYQEEDDNRREMLASVNYSISTDDISIFSQEAVKKQSSLASMTLVATRQRQVTIRIATKKERRQEACKSSGCFRTSESNTKRLRTSSSVCLCFLCTVFCDFV